MAQSPFHDLQVPPMDVYNRQLLRNVHPPDWHNPSPADCYDLVVIGAGTAGLVTAKGAAGLGLGLKVALIEQHLMGGDCLNVGCVPSKCLIRSSRVVADVQHAASFGIALPEKAQTNFPAVMERMRQIRARISPVDSAASAQKVGVDVFLGQAQFSGAHALMVDGQLLRFKKAVITTGARPVHPEIEGLTTARYLTNETVFSLTELPRRLAVIGAGPIGCELAQTFRRFGAEVTLLDRNERILPHEDAEAAAIVQDVFVQEGIRLVLGCQVSQVEVTPAGKVIHVKGYGPIDAIAADEILVGVGRAPNVEPLNLEAVGVRYDVRQGIQVDDYLQTTNPAIFAAGDVCMRWKFTHAADAAARIVIKNALFAPLGLGKSRLSNLVMPWTTYTDPEVAHVGLYEQEAQEQGIAVSTIKIPFSDVDRALADGEEAGFLKIHHKKGSDRIVGATMVARHAGDMVSEITTAIVHKIGLSALSSVIHPYPTQAEAIKKAADAYRRTLLTDRTRALLKFLTKLS